MHRFCVGLFSLLLSCLAGNTPALAVDYEFDLAFNSNYWIDAFTSGEAAGAQRYTSGLVRLPDGDIVIAGRVRLDNDPIEPNWNLGLLRMSPSGTRQVWSASGTYFHAGNQYVVFPNLAGGGSGITTIRKVADIAYARGLIFVLVRTLFSSTPVDNDVQLFVFEESGRLLNTINVLNSNEDEDAIALSVIETGQPANPIAVAVLGLVSGIRGAVAKYLVNSSNVLQLDTSFGGGDGRLEFVLPLTECDFPDCNYYPTDIAFPQGGSGGSNKPIYVSGSAQRVSSTSSDYDMVVFKFTPSGVLDNGFDFNGVRQYAFDQQDSSFADFASDLIVLRSAIGNFDTGWIAGPVARRCSQGVGIVKFDGASGAPDSSFGSVGRAVFGDDTTPPGAPCEPEVSVNPAGMVQQDGEIAVAATGFNLAMSYQAGVLLRLSASTGQRYSLDTFRLFDGDEYHKNELTGIVTGEGGGRYYVSGSGRTAAYNSLYLAARLRPVGDQVFRGGFEP